VFDWNRVGLDGKPRDLHLEASMASIDFDDFEPGLINSHGRSETHWKIRELVRHPLFHIDELHSPKGGAIPDPRRPGTPGVIGVVRGQLTVSGAGETVSVPAGGFVLLAASLSTATINVHPDAILLSVTPGA
jgi:mannose-6-phosphate isomerase